MAKLEIKDDCLTPDRHIFLRYNGPDPWGVVGKISGMIKPFFHVSTSSTNNDRLNWDVSGDPIQFYSTWWVKKSMSAYSKAKFYIKAQGEKSKTDNTGWFVMQMYADLETTFTGPGVVLKPMWLMYSYLFYNKVRRNYLDSCRNYAYNFRNEIKKHFNLEITSVPERGMSFG